MSASTVVATESGRRQTDSSALWYLSRLVAIVVGFIFLLAALRHLANPYFFLSTIYDYQLVSPSLGEGVAAVLPHLELVTGLFLIVGLWRRSAALIASILMSAFVAIQCIAWLRGLEISCGCFATTGAETIGRATILRDTAICALAWAVFGLSKRTT